MSSLAPTLQAFFTDRLIKQRRSSPFTVAAYRDTVRLLLAFIYQHNGKAPSALGMDDLSAPIIGAFLEHLEQRRGTPAAPGTRAWRPFIPSSDSRHSATLSMPR